MEGKREANTNANDGVDDKDNADCFGLVQRHLYGAAGVA